MKPSWSQRNPSLALYTALGVTLLVILELLALLHVL
jgi:hypothetical protein